jgi:hypothetical protein
MDQRDADMFANLTYRFGRAYEIHAGKLGWSATRRDDGSLVRCRTGAELEAEIRTDHEARPLGRRGQQ